MAIQNINIGAYANDGTGDDLRSAFNKINENFKALDLIVATEESNIGAVGQPIFKLETPDNLNSFGQKLLFRKIAGSTNITVSTISDSVTISAPDSINNLVEDTSPELGGDLVLNSHNVTGTGNINIAGSINATTVASTFTGNLTGNVTGNLTGNITGNTTGLHTGDVVGNVTGNLTGLHTGNVVGNVTGNLTGDVTGNVTGSSGSTTGNASTTSRLIIAKNINGVAFDGTQDITITASADTLYGTSLNSTVVNSQLTSVGTLTDLIVTNTITGSISGNAGTVSSISTHTLSELSDVDSTSPVDGQVLTWNSTLSTWTPAASTGGLTQVENDTSPLLGGNLGLNGHHIYGPGDVQTTVFGVSVEALNSLLSLLLESNSLNINLGTFTQPTGYQSNTNGYILDMGFFSDDPITNNIDLGTFA
jgi:hypothetical protein